MKSWQETKSNRHDLASMFCYAMTRATFDSQNKYYAACSYYCHAFAFDARTAVDKPCSFVTI